MIKVNLNMRTIYYFWIALNSAALILSEYFQKFSLAFLHSNFSFFREVSSKFYLLDTMDLKYYDLTEYLLFILIPYFLYQNFKKLFPRKRYNYL